MRGILSNSNMWCAQSLQHLAVWEQSIIWFRKGLFSLHAHTNEIYISLNSVTKWRDSVQDNTTNFICQGSEKAIAKELKQISQFLIIWVMPAAAGLLHRFERKQKPEIMLCLVLGTTWYHYRLCWILYREGGFLKFHKTELVKINWYNYIFNELACLVSNGNQEWLYDVFRHIHDIWFRFVHFFDYGIKSKCSKHDILK